MCGEKASPVFFALFLSGSPPRVRGKEHRPESKFRPGRITPACAGKSPSSVVLLLPVRDHPRVCGEKNLTLNYEDMQKGSPPRVRGKVFHLFYRFRLCGDHPRVCGEKHFGGIIRVCIVGSPPRVRGKGFRNLVEVRLIRITPAYAGKRRSASCLTCPPRDHPRVCGEK